MLQQGSEDGLVKQVRGRYQSRELLLSVGFSLKNTLQKELPLCQATGTNGEQGELIPALLALLFLEREVYWKYGEQAKFLYGWSEWIAHLLALLFV